MDSPDWPPERRRFWGDRLWWEALIDGAIAEPDPANANARITLVHKELSLALAAWDRTPDTPSGSAARDWTDIGDRINYIADLFRSRQHDPELLKPPFGAAEQARVLGLSARIHEGLA